MNRDIKFRVWDKSTEHFLADYQNHLHFIQSQIKVIGSGSVCKFGINNESLIVQQWTGCYDKNKIPIYEGDILVTDHDGGEGEANIGVVYFAAGTYMIDGDGPLYEHVFGHSPDILDNHTVIGNKFENPELLKA